MRTQAPIVINFDRPVDRGSVAARFSLRPAVRGAISWPSSRRLVFTHPPLRTDTEYKVILAPGYRSLEGGATDLEHTWTFRTEGPLKVTGWSPAGGDAGVDPASFLSVTFNHPIAQAALKAAFALAPATALDPHLDPADPARVVLAPRGLLAPDQTYSLSVRRSLRDQDGNPLPGGVAITFQTGPIRPLHGWLSYLQAPASGAAGAAASVWIVDSTRLPRQLIPGPVLAFAWSPAADEVAVETAPRTWADVPIGGMPTPIGVAADWLAPLGAQHGFALLDGGVLTLLAPDGRRSALAAGVQTAALAPDGSQIAYTIPGPSGTEVWAVSVELRTRYLVETEPGSVTGLTWSPDEQRLAYEVGTSSGGAIRVRAVNQGSAVTVATGQVSNPGWDADSQHLFVLGLTGSPVRARIYRLPVSGAPQALGGAGMPLTTSRDVGPPIVAPDGHQVAFLSGTELWLMNADGTGAARLSSPSYSCSDPLWTPA